MTSSSVAIDGRTLRGNRHLRPGDRRPSAVGAAGRADLRAATSGLHVARSQAQIDGTHVASNVADLGDSVFVASVHVQLVGSTDDWESIADRGGRIDSGWTRPWRPRGR